MKRKVLLGVALVVGLALLLGIFARGSPIPGERGGIAAASSGPTVIATVPVGSDPWGVAVNPTTNRIYVANYMGNNVSVIDGGTNTVVATIPVGTGPFGVAVNPSSNRVYVANLFNSNVSVIDGGTNTVVATVPVGVSPLYVAVNPTTNRIYVGNAASDSVSVIDGGTNRVVATVPVGDGPYGVAVNPTTNRVYVANLYSNDVSVIDGRTNTVVATVLVDSYPWGVAVNPTTNRIYVTNHEGNNVSVIDGGTNTVVATIPVGTRPWSVAVNPGTNRIYVLNASNDNPSVIDGGTNTVVDTLPSGTLSQGVAVNPTTNRIYVAMCCGLDRVYVIQDGASPPPPDNYKLSVPDFKQGDTQWRNQKYDAIKSDIWHSGCALTSAADVLAAWGVSTNPQALNDCLNANNGYSGGGVKWNVVAAKCTGPGVQLKASKYGPSPPDTNTTALRASLDGGQPVILGVQSGGYNPGHFVVAIGPDGGTWWINDPAGPANTLNTYGNTFVERVVFTPGAGNKAQAVLRAHSPVEFIVTDPLGRRLGLDPRTDTFYNEIPDASYGPEGAIVDQQTGDLIVPGTETAWLNSPLDGEYGIQVIGTDNGVYAMDGEFIADDGSLSHVDGPVGATTAGQVDVAQLNYTSDPAEDGDGVPAEVDNCPLVYNPDQLDTGEDGLGNACDPDDDNDGLADVDEVARGTDPLNPDTDGDTVLDGADNCPLVANPGQENTDSGPSPSGKGAIDNGPGISGGDATIPNGDTMGDACDPDADNDGLPDAQDTNPLGATGLCAAFAGFDDGHPNPAGGDVTNDDNHNGDPALPAGTDAADNGPSWDTDNDGALDGAECTLGRNPRNRADRPSTAQCGGTGDTDGDGLLDAWETCGWGTDKAVVDSDGDTRGDCKEAADVDGNGLVNFVGDTMYYAQAILLPPASFGKTMDFDINKNGLVDFVGDVMLEAQFALITGMCK